MGGMEAGQELYQQGTIDPSSVAIAAGAGAAFPTERPWLKDLNVMPLTKRSQVESGATTGRPNTPDKPEGEALRQEADANDVTAVAIGATNDNVAQTNTRPSDANVTDGGATLQVVRGAPNYSKTNVSAAPEGEPAAPSTVMDTGDAPDLDIQAALGAAQDDEGLGVGNQEQTYIGNMPEQPEPQAPQTPQAPQPDRRVQNVVRQDIDRRAQGTVPRAQQGNGGEAFQPEPPEIAENPLANPGRPAAPQGTPQLAGVPAPDVNAMPVHVKDVLTQPDVQKAMSEKAPIEGIPQHAITPAGRFDPQSAAAIHDSVGEWVHNYLVDRGMDQGAAARVAEGDFAQPAEDAYYKGLGIDPAQADRWWSRQGEAGERFATPAEPVDPAEQAQANKILTDQDLVEPKAAAPEQATKAQPKAIELALSRLRERGDEAAATKLEQMEPDKALAAAAKINKQHTNAAGRPTIDGIQLRGSKDEVARKQSADQAYKAAYDKFKPQADEDDQEIIERAKSAVELARSSHGGKNPVDKSEGYAPREKPPAWQFIKRAQDLIENPSDANIEKFRADEAQGWSKDVAQTNRIQADIKLNERPNAEEANAAGKAQAPPEARTQFPDVTQDDTSEARERQSLHDYINGLSDFEYNKVANIYGDKDNTFEQVVNTTSHPAKLQQHLEVELDPTGLKKPEFDVAPAEESPVSTKKKITNASRPRSASRDPDRSRDRLPGARLPPSEGAASKGRSRKDLIAEYNKKLKAGELLPSNTERAPVNDITRDAQDVGARATPFEGGSALTQKLKDWMGDNMPKWMTGDPADPMSVKPEQAAQDYTDSLGDNIQKLRNKYTRVDIQLMKHNKDNLPKFSEKMKANMDAVHKAFVDKTLTTLTPEQNELYQKTARPLLQKLDSLHLRAQDLGVELPMLEEGVEKGFWPRRVVTDPDVEDVKADPYVRQRSLTDWDPATQKRDFEAITDQAGDRRVVKDNGDGTLTTWNNGGAHKYAVNNMGDIGSKITFDGGALKGKDWWVDHATDAEITQHVRDENGKPIEYADPYGSLVQAVRGMSRVVANKELANDIVASLPAKGLSTTDPVLAKKLGYIQTQMPTFEKFTGNPADLKNKAGDYLPGILPHKQRAPLYMDKNIAWTLDDYARQGFQTPWDTAASGLIKTMYATNPFIHPLNELSLWFEGRGWDNITPKGVQSLFKDGFSAMRSVMNPGDALDAEIHAAGGSLMHTSTVTRDFTKDLYARIGQEMIKNPSVFDPLTRAFGIDVPQLAQSMYNQSSKLTWALSDLLYKQRYLELRGKGMTPEDAVKKTEEFISNYRIGPTVAGNRFVAQVLGSEGLSLFGRYHAGLWHTFANIGRKLAKGTPSERLDAAGNVAAMLVMAYVVYPAINYLVQKGTGNDQASIHPRGADVITNTLADIARGHKDYSALVPNVITPSLPVNAAIEGVKNLDWTGKRIIPQADLTSPKNAGRAAAQGVDFLGRNLVPPYSDLSNVVRQPGASVGSVAKHFAEEQVGIRNPSVASSKYMRNIDKNNRREQIQRQKKPQGLAEEIYNSLTR